MNEVMRAWIVLAVAGVFEVAWAILLKYSEGFTKLWYSVATGIFLALSMFLLGYAVRTLPIGTAYAIWTGIGAVGTAILGIFLFNESREFLRIFFIFLIVVGIIGLKFFSGKN